MGIDVESLRRAIAPVPWVDDRHDLAAFERGWRYGSGRALAAVRPSTTEEVAHVLRACAERCVRVQPIGANTGLVGASNADPSGEQLVLSLDRLNRRLEIDPVDRTVLVDAGVTASRLEEELAPHGLTFPIDLGADPTIGGMIATNTGGSRLVRHGDVRRHLLGLEVVLADGSVLSKLSRLRKDNTGLDWKQLFVGTSGAFGVITRAVLSVEPRPIQRVTAAAAASSGEGVLALLRALESGVDETLSAFEVLSREALEATLAHGAGVTSPFAGDAPRYTALVELSSVLPSSALSLDELLLESLGELLESDAGIDDVVLGRGDELWRIRHQVSESLRHEGAVLALDLSVPRSSLARFSEAARELIRETRPDVRVMDFGHWGDGGTHLNLVYEPDDVPPEATRELQAALYDLCVREFGGSFSAEHGIGPHNQRDYERFTPERVRALCAALQDHLDPERRIGTVRL